MQPPSTLESLFGFTRDDLAANRDGRLSRRQSNRLLRSGVWRLVIGTSLVIGSAIATLLTDAAFYTLAALMGLCLGLFLAWSGFAFLVDALEGSVAFVTATMHGRITRYRNSTSHWADIGPITKKISASQHTLLPEGLSSHAYYAPGCRSLLAVEPAFAEEPRPAHAFGPDSAHAWDRLRWSWVLVTVGVFGALVAAHQIAAAHPAHPIKVAGTVENYIETTRQTRGGTHTDRALYLAGDDNVYVPKREDDYSPPAPDFYSLIGSHVVLYVNEGTSDVLALDVGERLYASDWYLNPGHQTAFMQINGALSAAAAALFLALGLILLRRDRQAVVLGGDDEAQIRSAAYAPPTVRPLAKLWPGALVVAAVGVFIGMIVAAQR